MNSHDSVLMELEAERHNHRKNNEELIRQRDEARRDLENMLRSTEITITTLTKERNELGATLASVSDALETVRKASHAPKDVILAEAVTKLRLERDEARAEVERLTRERDDYKRDFENELNGTGELRKRLGAKDDEDFASFIERLALERDEAMRREAVLRADADAMLRKLEQQSAADAESTSPAPNFSTNPEWISSAHAEKVLVAVAKAAAQVGAEDVRNKLEKHFLLLARDADEKTAKLRAKGAQASDVLAWAWTRVTFERCASDAQNWTGDGR